jgi:two-component system, NtrC family, nitrogen regulation response regulator GlnG
MAHVLVVDDEPSICWGLSQLAENLGHSVAGASSAEQGLALAREQSPDLVILDVRLPGMDGLTAIQLFRPIIGSAPIIVITAFGDLATAVKAVQNGAFEYVLKPFDLKEIRDAMERALRTPVLAPAADATPGVGGMLGESPAMQAVFKRIALAAASDAAVLLTGERGVGKELAAGAIHRHSAQAAGPFVAMNIAAIDPALVEAELFGQVAGASPARTGLLVQANGGTLLINEPADIPLPLQAKLLRTLEQGAVTPLGADAPAPTRFRVIAATDQNLLDLAEAGQFRQDLYYWLSTFEITLPPLRERGTDVSMLARYFTGQLSGDAGMLAAETIDDLRNRPWHGNVLELRSAMEHALVLARSGVILPDHLPPPWPQSSYGASGSQLGGSLDEAVSQLAERLLHDPASAGLVYDRFLEEVEPPLLAAAMGASGERCAVAARTLGLHRTTLRRKLDRYGVDESEANTTD